MNGRWTSSGPICYPFARPAHSDTGDPMRFQFIPRNENFYDLFEKAAANMAEAARMLLKMITDFSDPEAQHAEIRQREHEGDEMTHQIMHALNTTFVRSEERRVGKECRSR